MAIDFLWHNGLRTYVATSGCDRTVDPVRIRSNLFSRILPSTAEIRVMNPELSGPVAECQPAIFVLDDATLIVAIHKRLNLRLKRGEIRLPFLPDGV